MIDNNIKYFILGYFFSEFTNFTFDIQMAFGDWLYENKPNSFFRKIWWSPKEILDNKEK